MATLNLEKVNNNEIIAPTSRAGRTDGGDNCDSKKIKKTELTFVIFPF